MHEITLTLQFTPQSLVRVGLGPDRAVYVPIQKETNETVRLYQNGEPVWSNGVADVFIAAYADHIEVTLAVQAPPGQVQEAMMQAG